MDIYDAILTRRSVADLVAPAATRAQVERLLDAAVMAPTHHMTEPWRFVVLTGDALEELGETFAASAEAAGKNVEAARRLPTRSPMVVVVVDRSGNHHHVPASDEHYAVGAAMQNLLLAAHAEGLGAMIRTGIHVRRPGPGTHGRQVRRDHRRVRLRRVRRERRATSHPTAHAGIPADRMARYRPVLKGPAVSTLPLDGNRRTVIVTVPDMLSRAAIRAVTAPIRDVPGVVAVQAHLDTHQVHVEGAMEVAAVWEAIEGAGYRVSR